LRRSAREARRRCSSHVSGSRREPEDSNREREGVAAHASNGRGAEGRHEVSVLTGYARTRVSGYPKPPSKGQLRRWRRGFLPGVQLGCLGMATGIRFKASAPCEYQQSTGPGRRERRRTKASRREPTLTTAARSWAEKAADQVRKSLPSVPSLIDAKSSLFDRAFRRCGIAWPPTPRVLERLSRIRKISEHFGRVSSRVPRTARTLTLSRPARGQASRRRG
jgi:hypothetical protein